MLSLPVIWKHCIRMQSQDAQETMKPICPAACGGSHVVFDQTSWKAEYKKLISSRTRKTLTKEKSTKKKEEDKPMKKREKEKTEDTRQEKHD